MTRYSPVEPRTLDGLIACLTDARAHGARGDSVVKAYDGDSEAEEPVTGFIIDNDSGLIRLYTDEP
jgi:hypothetical protein